MSFSKNLGQDIAAKVATVLHRPARIAACLGAMSSKLTLRLDLEKAELATARVSAAEARGWLLAWPANTRKIISPPSPTQVKIFLTLVVVEEVFILRISATRPLSGTAIAMTRCGKMLCQIPKREENTSWKYLAWVAISR